jgi:hypothetical protein
MSTCFRSGRGWEVEGFELRPSPFFVGAEDDDAAPNLLRVTAARHGISSCCSAPASSVSLI